MRMPKPTIMVSTAAVVAAALCATPAAASAVHRLKLKVVVTGQTSSATRERIKGSMFKGSEKVGTFQVNPGNCAGLYCANTGTADLKARAGLFKGEATIRFFFKYSITCLEGRPGCVDPKSGTGYIQQGDTKEKFTVNVGSVPTTKGAKFTMTLSY